MSALLSFDKISRNWFGIPAVSQFSLVLEENSALGLVGQNGAGKSTLMNMIGGIVKPSSGRMQWKNELYAPKSAADASRAGIAFIHQELNLFTNLSVAENLYINGFPRRFGLIDWPTINSRTRSILERLSLSVEPSVLVGNLSPGEQQLVEIARALHNEAQLIIFDEPTTSLTPRETSRLFDTIATLRSEGRSIVYISHILSDVLLQAERIAVLRDGELVDQGAVEEFSIPRMIRSMIGHDLKGQFPSRGNLPTDEPLLTVTSVSQPGVLELVSLKLMHGEVLGLFGLMGSGRSELARVIFGLDPCTSGDIHLEGKLLEGSPRQRIAAGLAFVTENRREEGLMLDASISDNLTLASIDQFGRKPFKLVDREALSEHASATKTDLSIKAGNIAVQAVKSLSGGNQQKVVIGKWQMCSPKLFIMDEPTRGVDVGAKYEIYSLIDKMASAGDGVLMISSELDELLGMTDRILVMSRGEVVGVVARAEFDKEKILSMAFGEVMA